MGAIAKNNQTKWELTKERLNPEKAMRAKAKRKAQHKGSSLKIKATASHKGSSTTAQTK